MKIIFSDVLLKAADKISPSVIKKGFESTGIHPFDADKVNYSKLTGSVHDMPPPQLYDYEKSSEL
jgi:hypothetical protein